MIFNPSKVVKKLVSCDAALQGRAAFQNFRMRSLEEWVTFANSKSESSKRLGIQELNDKRLRYKVFSTRPPLQAVFFL